MKGGGDDMEDDLSKIDDRAHKLSIKSDVWFALAGKEKAITATPEEMVEWMSWVRWANSLGYYPNGLLNLRGLEALDPSVDFFPFPVQPELLQRAKQLVSRARVLELDPVTWVALAKNLDIDPEYATEGDRERVQGNLIPKAQEMGLDPVTWVALAKNLDIDPEYATLEDKATVQVAVQVLARASLTPATASPDQMKTAKAWMTRTQVLEMDPLMASEEQVLKIVEVLEHTHNKTPETATPEELSMAKKWITRTQILEMDPLMASEEQVLELEEVLEHHDLTPATASPGQMVAAKAWIKRVRAAGLDPSSLTDQSGDKAIDDKFSSTTRRVKIFCDERHQCKPGYTCIEHVCVASDDDSDYVDT
jgi:uracil phosphoribosyltransferase